MTLGRDSERNFKGEITTISIPTYWVGPLHVNNYVIEKVPLACLETALAPSTQRGLKIIRESGGCTTAYLDNGWSRTSLFTFPDITEADRFRKAVVTPEEKENITQTAQRTTQYGKVEEIKPYLIGRDVFMYLRMNTGDASGQNMVTKATSAVTEYLCKKFPCAQCVAVSGDSSDKKGNAKNSLLGHGCSVSAAVKISSEMCSSIFRVQPQDIVRLVTKKDYIGSLFAGSTASANAHYANLLVATFLATGQDPANIVEGSQGFTTAEVTDTELYFTVNLPTLVIGTIGNGKDKGSQRENLEKLGCYGSGTPLGANKQRLAEIIAATTLAGELSLHAALVSPHSKQLVDAHVHFERK